MKTVWTIIKVLLMCVGLPLTVVGFTIVIWPIAPAPIAAVSAATVFALFLPAFIAGLYAKIVEEPPEGRFTDLVALSWIIVPTLSFALIATPLFQTSVSQFTEDIAPGAPEISRMMHEMLLDTPPQTPSVDQPAPIQNADVGVMSDTSVAKAPAAEPGPSLAIELARNDVTHALRQATAAKPKQLEPRQIFETCANTVVSIAIKDRVVGTGFFVNPELVATNWHVARVNPKDIVVRTKMGPISTSADVVAKEKKRDLALIKVAFEAPIEQTFCPLGRSENVGVGQEVVAVGNPFGLELSVSSGIVSQRRELHDQKYVQFTAPVSPGNSGGPLFNDHGEIVGVVTMQYGGFRAQNINMAVPIDDLKPMIKKVGEHGEVASKVDHGTW